MLRTGIFPGCTDFHCHILPGVDDGVQTVGEALEILGLYESVGVASVWLTPHIMEDCPNGTAFLRERFEEFRQAYKATGGGITLHLAAENMLDNLFEERLERGDLLTMGGKREHLLVETSYFSPPLHLDATLERIKSAGLFPILAHPERYVYMDERDYRRLKSAGILFQLNWYSLAGIYGKGVQKKAEWLLDNHFYDICGSDTHRLRILRSALGRKAVGSAAARQLSELVRSNPLKL